jgi:2-polyprenyl-3-methyl-5-hydroxy-6-metoxy-1,4-benzoquinol methylase
MDELAQLQIKKNTQNPCPICSSSKLQDVIEIPGLPLLSNVLWDKREDALAAPRGDVRLVFCETCGHVFNQAFNPEQVKYDVEYENSLHFSPHFQSYATRLANYLVDRYDLHDKKIIEIGSGKGEFLRMLCQVGKNHGTGFDPSYEPATAEASSAGDASAISFVKDIYSERYSSYQADLILSRHVLEHIYQPVEFIRSLRRTIGDRIETVVFCEVPNLAYILRDTTIWDIIYEHYSYFNSHSLAEIFSREGFHVLNVAETFHSQFLFLEADLQKRGRPTSNASNGRPIEGLAEKVAHFAERSQAKLTRWNEQVEALRKSGKRAVLWGAGSKGISFLNMLPTGNGIEFIVDINPRKRNKYVTGAGQQIVPPEFLKTYRPEVIIIMNPVYQPEIQAEVDRFGLQIEFLPAI